MCVVSAVHDHYYPQVPDVQPGWPYPPKEVPSAGTVNLFSGITLDQLKTELAKLLSDFTKAIEAAKVVDELTNQPDCVDPEKAKLLDKVKDLEDMLTKGVVFFEVVKKGGLKLSPGKYRVVDGQLWKIEEKRIE